MVTDIYYFTMVVVFTSLCFIPYKLYFFLLETLYYTV